MAEAAEKRRARRARRRAQGLCAQCGKVKTTHYRCAACRAKKMEHYRSHREHYTAKLKTNAKFYYDSNMRKLLELMGGHCERCGHPLTTLKGSKWHVEYHHINPFEHGDRRGECLTTLANTGPFKSCLPKVWKEAMSCQALCHECHRKAHEELAETLGIQPSHLNTYLKQFRAYVRGVKMKRKEKGCSRES